MELSPSCDRAARRANNAGLGEAPSDVHLVCAAGSPTEGVLMKCRVGSAYGVAPKRWEFPPDGLVRRTGRSRPARPNVRSRRPQVCRPSLHACGVAKFFGRNPHSGPA